MISEELQLTFVKLKTIKEILVTNNIFQFVDGYICLDASSQPLYVWVSSVFREQDYQNAVFINVIIQIIRYI